MGIEQSDSCEIPQERATDAQIRHVLEAYRTIAVVGLSHDPRKPAHAVPKYLQEHGYDIIPVNPTVSGTLLGQPVYARLKDIPRRVEVVEVFRLPREAPGIVEDAIAIGARAVWLQQGIVNNEAAERARAAGLEIIMDRCMMVEHRKLRPPSA